ncbi:MAG: hypothetical protein AB7I45_16870 [Planctomycetota bacterium]
MAVSGTLVRFGGTGPRVQALTAIRDVWRDLARLVVGIPILRLVERDSGMRGEAARLIGAPVAESTSAQQLRHELCFVGFA